jgi:hypothetical protein
MDEIEFTPEISQILLRINRNGNLFANAVHRLEYINNYDHNIEIADMNKAMILDRICWEKNEEVLCGPTCAEMIVRYFYGKEYRDSDSFVWCAELALNLIKHGIKVETYCYNSRLYDDYVNSRIIFSPLDELKKYTLLQKELTENILTDEVNNSECVVLCVDSAKYNNDRDVAGGHFIFIFTHDGILYSLNPQKTSVFKEIRCISEYVSSSVNYGAWRILCKGVAQ